MEKFKKYLWIVLTAIGSIFAFTLLKPNNKKRHDKKDTNNKIKQVDTEIENVKLQQEQLQKQKVETKSKINTSNNKIKDLENKKTKTNSNNTDVTKAVNHLNNI